MYGQFWNAHDTKYRLSFNSEQANKQASIQTKHTLLHLVNDSYVLSYIMLSYGRWDYQAHVVLNWVVFSISAYAPIVAMFMFSSEPAAYVIAQNDFSAFSLGVSIAAADHTDHE